MQAFIEYLPWIIFGLVYKFAGGIYPATASLMGAMALLLLYDWITTRKVPQLHLVLAIFVWVFGAATLILQDVRFLQWKASVFYWIGGLAFVGSLWIGEKTLLERIFAKGLPEEVVIPPSRWRSSSILMGAFYLLLGFSNIWVAFNRSESDWVTFKVWIVGGVGIVFSVAVILWLMWPALRKEEPAS